MYGHEWHPWNEWADVLADSAADGNQIGSAVIPDTIRDLVRGTGNRAQWVFLLFAPHDVLQQYPSLNSQGNWDIEKTCGECNYRVDGDAIAPSWIGS